MATAKQLPSGSWRVQVYAGRDPSGRRRYRSFTSRSKKEAEYNALQFQLHHRETAQNAAAMTLSEAMERYISSKDGVLSPSTIRGYEAIRRTNLPGLMPMRLDRLTPQLIQQAVNQEAKPYTDARGRRRTRSPKTIRNIHGLLSAVLAEYHPGLKLRTTLPQREAAEQKILEPEQIAALLSAVRGDVMELPVLMGVWLCMRESEITALTWDCVDLARGTLTVKKALVRGKDGGWVEKTTKTASSTRTLRLSGYVLDRLKAAKAEADGPRVVPLSGPALYRRFKTILRRSRLPDIRFHDLRHTAASVMLTLNVPDKYAQARGGWATSHTMKAVYQHTMDAKRAAVDAAIDAFYEALTPERFAAVRAAGEGPEGSPCSAPVWPGG